MTPLKPTPWGIDFAEPEGSVAEKLRKLTAIQAKLIAAANAEMPGPKRFKEFYNPRFHAVGHALAVLRMTLPSAGRDPTGEPAVKYDRAAVRKTAEFAADLAAVDLGKTFSGEKRIAEPPDPYEDFSAPNYSKTDPNGRYAIGDGAATDSKITVTGLTRNEDAYIWKDFGAAHFGSSFEHKLQIKTTGFGGGGYPVGTCWAASNIINDAGYWSSNNSEALWLYAWLNGNLADTRIKAKDNESESADEYSGASGETDYYITVDRDGASCAVYIRTGSHGGSLADTLSVSLDSGRTYRYMFGGNTYNSGETWSMSYYVQDLDLQEAAAANGALRPWEFAFQFGVR